MHVKAPSGAQIHLPVLSASRAVSGTAIRPKAPSEWDHDTAQLCGTVSRASQQSWKSAFSSCPPPSSNANTHQNFSTAKPHLPAPTWSTHPCRTNEAPDGGAILPDTDSTDPGRQRFQWSVWLSLEHATDTMSYFSMEHSHARLWSEGWGERRKLGIKLGKMCWRQRGQPGVPQDHPHSWTSTGCPVPNPSLAVWVPGTRFPGGRSYSCNAPRGAELRMGPSLAVASIPTSASAEKF